MRNYVKYLFLAIFNILILAGCTYRINPQNINSAIIPKDTINIVNFMASKTYSTYDPNLEKITMYYFKSENNQLRMSFTVSYIPFDYYYELYTEFSDVTMTLRSLTHGKFMTLPSALENEVERHHYTRLFKNKDEFIIGNDFAFQIQTAIQRYNDWIQSHEWHNDRLK